MFRQALRATSHFSHPKLRSPQFPGGLKFFSSSKDPSDVVIEEESSEDPPKNHRDTSQKNQAYHFYDKSIAIALENPLFPYNKQTLYLGPNHSKFLNTRMPHFITAVLEKKSSAFMDVPDAATEDPKTEETSKDVAKGSIENMTAAHYGMGTYCSVQYNSQNMNKITLRGIHRVDVKDIKAYS
jgi:hypothetical protein